MSKQIPFVSFLALAPEPHLIAQECRTCGARFFDRRNACAACFATEFQGVPIQSTGVLKSYTIVCAAAPGVHVPFAAGLIDCGGTSVEANVINCPPDPDHLSLGMPVRLATYSLGADGEGTEAIVFGYEPIEAGAN